MSAGPATYTCCWSRGYTERSDRQPGSPETMDTKPYFLKENAMCLQAYYFPDDN